MFMARYGVFLSYSRTEALHKRLPPWLLDQTPPLRQKHGFTRP